MKKLAIATILATAAFAASAVEVGVTAVDQTSPNPNRYGYGVTVGQNFGAYNVTAGVSRFVREANDQTRVTLVGSREVAKVGPVSLTGRVGVAYLNNQTGEDGSALTVGVGASVPVAKNVTAGLSVDRQYGQNRVSSFDGNVITAGVKVGF
jgi:long-subunit fatty acid transport protein